MPRGGAVSELITCPVAEKTGENTPLRVLFVCTGNTCRSPMAAALLSHMAERDTPPRFTADSAGLFATEGAPMSENAVAALRGMGITPPSHTARRVTRAQLENTDLIVGLTASHAMELAMRAPDLVERITTLPMDIADPYGGDAEVYARCAEQLRLSLEIAFFGGDV